MAENIHTVFDQILTRKDKESLLNQRSCTIWLTGLSGSGKTSIASWLERKLHSEGFLVQVLDGDNIRSGINNNLSFTEEDRKENIRRIAEISKLYINSGVITINGFVSPTNEVRDLAKSIIGEEDFIEVFINTPLHVCEERDVKGLYKKARSGEIKNFTGIGAPFDVPKDADCVVETENSTIAESGQKLYDFVIKRIKK